MSDSDPIGLVTWLGEKLSGYGLAYWHMMRADFLGQQSGDVITAARAAYRGVLVGNMGYSPQEAADAIAVKKLDAVAFGTPFLANPDLPARVKAGAELNTPDAVTFYSPGAKGYTDYPAMAG
jgi:N-ethylmaleimide reductase